MILPVICFVFIFYGPICKWTLFNVTDNTIKMKQIYYVPIVIGISTLAAVSYMYIRNAQTKTTEPEQESKEAEPAPKEEKEL